MCLTCGEKYYGSLRSIDVVFHLPQMTHQTLSNSHSVVAAVQEQSYSLHFHLYIACNIVPEAVGMDRHAQPPSYTEKESTLLSNLGHYTNSYSKYLLLKVLVAISMNALPIPG